jgi:1-deoxy-D-xylulose-5-phosphate synthase
MCLDRGGLVGADGATHHGVFDMAFLRCIPNLVIASPMNEEELRNLMFTAQNKPRGPFVIRYPRGRGVMKNWRNSFNEIEIGKGRKLADGARLAVLSIGHPGNFVLMLYLFAGKYSVAHSIIRFLNLSTRIVTRSLFFL